MKPTLNPFDRLRRLRSLRRASAPRQDAAPEAIVPVDPASLSTTLDPALQEIRAGLVRHRRRLWLRRSVRRAWFVLASVAAAELVLAVAARLTPIETAPIAAAAIPVLGLVVLLVLVTRVRPSIGETALALDAEAGTGDRLASALAFAATLPSTAGPDGDEAEDGIAVNPDGAFDVVAA
jgi:hypothetical protein